MSSRVDIIEYYLSTFTFNYYNNKLLPKFAILSLCWSSWLELKQTCHGLLRPEFELLWSLQSHRFVIIVNLILKCLKPAFFLTASRRQHIWLHQSLWTLGSFDQWPHGSVRLVWLNYKVQFIIETEIELKHLTF